MSCLGFTMFDMNVCMF